VTLVVDVAVEDVRVALARSRIADIARGVLRAERVREALLSVTFVTDRRIATLNREYLGHRGATDVISFGFTRPRAGDPVVADVYIAPAVARRNAAAAGVGQREELTRLVVHGVLHALGFDHADGEERTDSRMWRRQEQLVARALRAVTRKRTRVARPRCPGSSARSLRPSPPSALSSTAHSCPSDHRLRRPQVRRPSSGIASARTEHSA
jgi:probable rRNA maturation factor